MRRPAPVQYIHIPSHGQSGQISGGRRRRRFNAPRLGDGAKRVALGIVALLAIGAIAYFLLGRGGGEDGATVGAVESVAVDGATMIVSGYAYNVDNDIDTPVDLRAVVDGEAVDLQPTLQRGRPADFDPAPQRVDRFEFSPELTDGEHEVCVVAIEDAEEITLGCAKAFVRTPFFDGRMIVAHYGAPGIPELGIAGETTPELAAAAVQAQALEWTNQNLTIVPAFDMIASVATAAPGADGFYASPIPIDEIRPYLDAVRAVDGILIIDIQSGARDFLTAAQEYEELLLEPDVHLALDPEWRVPEGVAPGSIIGTVEIAEVNEVGAWLAQLVRDNDLPEKIFLIHQFQEDMVRDRDLLVDQPELAEVFHIDGFGSPELKVNVYNQIGVAPPLVNGLKLFFDEDTVLLTSAEVRNLFVPFPLLITYQ